MLRQTVRIISKLSMNSNWRFSADTLNLCKNRRFCDPCDLDIWRMPSKIVENLFYATVSVVHHFDFAAICEFKLELQSENDQIGRKICYDLCDRGLRRLTLTLSMDITVVNSSNSWNFHDNTMTATLWKRRDRQTDGVTEVFLELLGCS